MQNCLCLLIVCCKEGMDGKDEDTPVNFRRVGHKERWGLAKSQSTPKLLLTTPTKGSVLRGFALEAAVALGCSLPSLFVSLCLLSVASHLFSLPLSPPHCGAIQIEWTCFSFRFTLCTLTNLLPGSLPPDPGTSYLYGN